MVLEAEQKNTHTHPFHPISARNQHPHLQDRQEVHASLGGLVAFDLPLQAPHVGGQSPSSHQTPKATRTVVRGATLKVGN